MEKNDSDTSKVLAAGWRYCDACARGIHVGTAADHNWATHVKSGAHALAASLAKKKPPRKITAFFRPSEPSASAARSAVPGPARIKPVISPRTSKPEDHLIIAPDTSRVVQDEHTLAAPVRELRALLNTLPSAPSPSHSDTGITHFDYTPVFSLEDGDNEYESHWQFVDCSLNRALGYGLTPEELAKKIEDGSLRLDGLCGWLATVLNWPGVSLDLLEGKISRLKAALLLRGAKCSPEDTPDVLECDETLSPRMTAMSMPSEPKAPPAQVHGYRPLEPTSKDSCQPKVSDATSATSSSQLSTESSKVRRGRPTCPGFLLEIPLGASPYGSYPFGLHVKTSLPWHVSISSSGLMLHSITCAGTTSAQNGADNHVPCRQCGALASNSVLQGIKQRMENGIHENTPFQFHSFDSTLEVLRRKNVQLERMRFDKVNQARKNLARARTIDTYKRFILSVSHSDLHARVHKVVSVARRNHMGIHAILDKLDRANKHVYSSTSYDEVDFQRSYLLWKLGGQHAADIGGRSLGLPSLSATRRWKSIRPLVASPSAPTEAEMAQNLSSCLPLEPFSALSTAGPTTAHVPTPYIILVDEIKLEERFRWEPATNMILGVCREHGSLCSLEFKSREEIQILGELLSNKSVHAATEATVIAIAVLSDKHHEYAARPFVISGTCKREDAEEHAKLLQRAITAVRLHISASGGKVYSISSDGEARRCKSLGLLTMCYELSTSSPLYRLLGPLPLFNRLVGSEDLVCNKDWRHVLKRLRNTLVRAAPLHINGSTLTRPLIKRHLVDGLGMSSSTADSLLSPNDPQDVVLAFRLLNAISTLPMVSTDATPLYYGTRNVLCLLGRLYSRLLRCYTDLALSLREQLEHLSAVAHLLLALYMQDKGGFIPAILYLDVQIMVKNAYFCLAKILVDNPESGRLWIICLGTDALEKIFALVRTMIGCDSNVDQLQLASRASGATQCAHILQLHPEWDRGPRRLAIPSLHGRGDDVSASADHVNPRSWAGDVSTKGILPQTCWYRGRQAADAILSEFHIPPPFDDLSCSLPRRDMLRPFSEGTLVYLGGLRSGDVAEEELQPAVPSAAPPRPPSASTDACSLEPDLEDLLGTEDVDSCASEQSPAAPKVDAWLMINDTPGAKKQHKSTFLRLLSQNPKSFTTFSAGSTDRLSRTCGYTRYAHSRVILNDDTEFGEAMLGFDDPAITLVRVDNLLFLAVIQICDIKRGGQSTCTLKVEELASADVRVKFEVLSLRPMVPTVDNREADWVWNGRFEPFRSSPTREVEGRAIQPIDPQLVSDLTLRTTGGISRSTYHFRTTELRALACEIFRSGLSDVAWAEVPRTASFPYRTESDALCFLCETETASLDSNDHGWQRNLCPLCPGMLLSTRQHGVLLNHIAAHILHDPNVDRFANPCGFCLSTGETCAIYLKKTKGSHGGDSVDMENSRCPGKYKLVISKASKSSARSPSTNVPVRCPLCKKGARAIWKYNLVHHLRRVHKQDPEKLATSLWKVSDAETSALKTLLATQPRNTKRKRQSKKATATATQISEAHTCRMAVRISDLEGQSPGLNAARKADEAGGTLDGDSPLLNTVNADESSDSSAESSSGESGTHDMVLSSPGSGGEVTSETDSLSLDEDDDEPRAPPSQNDQPLNGGHHTPPQRSAVIAIGSTSALAGPAPPAAGPVTGGLLRIRLPARLPVGHSSESGMQALDGPSNLGDSEATQRDTAGSAGISSMTTPNVITSPASSSSMLTGVCICGEANSAAMVKCNGPACEQMFHYDCVNLKMAPTADWFCDNYCRENAGARAKGKRRRKRVKTTV